MDGYGKASVGLMAYGAVSGAIGTYFSAAGQRSSLEFQARIADINARIAEGSAQTALVQGERAVQGVRMHTAQVKSAQRVGLAANGIALDSDSAINVLTTTDVMGEQDAITTETNAIAQAWGYRTQSSNMQTTSALNNAAAGNINPGLSAAGSLIGNAGKVGAQWYMMNTGRSSTSGITT
jgi:hypothetical protein